MIRYVYMVHDILCWLSCKLGASKMVFRRIWVAVQVEWNYLYDYTTKINQVQLQSCQCTKSITGNSILSKYWILDLRVLFGGSGWPKARRPVKGRVGICCCRINALNYTKRYPNDSKHAYLLKNQVFRKKTIFSEKVPKNIEKPGFQRNTYKMFGFRFVRSYYCYIYYEWTSFCRSQTWEKKTMIHITIHRQIDTAS